MLSKDKRDSMVVMLEGYPEEDVDATLDKEEADAADSPEEALDMAAGKADMGSVKSELDRMVREWQPETDEGKSYLSEVEALLASL